MGRLLAFAARIGADDRDPDETRQRKLLFVVFTILVMPAGFFWGLIYAVAGVPLAAAPPFAYVLLSALNLAIFSRTRAYDVQREIQVFLILMLPFLMQLALGGWSGGSATVVWSVIAPFAALVLKGPRGGVPWALGFLGVVAASAILDPIVRRTTPLPEAFTIGMFAANVGAIFIVTFTLLSTFIVQRETALRQLAKEQERSESLLLNVLPREIAPRLKAGESPIADHYAEATVLFADIVGSTPLMERLPPKEAVALLNEVFSRFDVLADRHGVEKIRTIGDNFMCVAGVPRPGPDHAAAVARLALDMCAFLDELRARGEDRIDFRIGINSGPLVGGVIGLRKFVFDVWGDAVNTASRMESHGVPGRIHVTEATYQLLCDSFDLEPRGVVDVKGKGPMRTWFLVGEHRAETAPSTVAPVSS